MSKAILIMDMPENWCPLQYPSDKEGNSECFDEYEDGYAYGWNSCIEEIIGR